MLRSLLLVALALFLLPACPTTVEPVDWRCSPADVAVDTLEATVDGDPWNAEFSGGTVTPAGGVNINFRLDSFNTLSLRLLTASTFTDLENSELADDLVEDGALAFEAGDRLLDIALGEGSVDGGDVTLILDSDSYNSDQADGGYARITSLEGKVLTGCMFFEAGQQNDDGETTLTDGSFSATLP